MLGFLVLAVGGVLCGGWWCGGWCVVGAVIGENSASMPMEEDSRAYAVLTTGEPVSPATLKPVDAFSPAVTQLPTAAVLLQESQKTQFRLQ